LNAARLYGIDIAAQKQRMQKIEKPGKSAPRKSDLSNVAVGKG
jgi:hypothetical protein